MVTDAQNCGNILAGVGPAAIERGLVAARDGRRRCASTC
jgi:4-oxalomesaconate tautomerase